MLALQEAIGARRQQAYEGRQVEVLFEGPGKHPGQWFGKTRGHYGVIVESPHELTGRLLPIEIQRSASHTLFGRPPHPALAKDFP